MTSKNQYEGKERCAICSDHTTLAVDVAGIRSIMRWMLLVFCSLLALIGYNIHATQKIETGIASQIAQIGGRIDGFDIKQANTNYRVDENGKAIKDLEYRVRTLER